VETPLDALATIVIAARNASGTIERAVRSAVIQGNYPILLVDDFSTDGTAALALAAGDGHVRVVRPSHHQSLGLTRQTGLEAVATKFGVWLDSDDELLPGRVERLLTRLDRENGDLASDAIELFDGRSSRYLGQLVIPEFLKGHQPLARLFERNYLPGVGVLAFRTEFALRIGFDPEIHGTEDMDFALRSISAGARFCLVDEPGYRQFAYPSSASRHRENQLEMYRRCLLKHDYGSVQRLFQVAGYDERICAWALVSMSLFRREFEKTLELVSLSESLIKEPDEVLEPSGPCPLPESWRLAFFRGTTLLMLEQWQEAEFWLEQAEKIRPTAEGVNNLGVATYRQGRLPEAQESFLRSLDRFPDFSDAGANRHFPTPLRVTLHPLRREPVRNDY
jgi:glycosyltransferase involved in cell wall biosynthesis